MGSKMRLLLLMDGRTSIYTGLFFNYDGKLAWVLRTDHVVENLAWLARWGRLAVRSCHRVYIRAHTNSLGTGICSCRCFSLIFSCRYGRSCCRLLVFLRLRLHLFSKVASRHGWLPRLLLVKSFRRLVIFGTRICGCSYVLRSDTSMLVLWV